MKKLGNALLLGALAAVLLTAVGCKQEASLGDEAEKWKSPSVVQKAQNILFINQDNDTIDWYCFVDENGLVVEPKKLTSHGAAKDKDLIFDFSELLTASGKQTQAYTVYIWQKNVKPTESKEANEIAGSRDFRGKVEVSKNNGIRISASKYKEEVLNVGIVTITCDEPVKGQLSGNSRYPNGDYTITQLRALMPLGKQNDTNQDLFQLNDKFTFDCSIGKGETKSFVFPANNGETVKSYVAMAQPNRMKDLTEAEWEELKKESSSTLWAKTFAEEKELDANRFWSFEKGVPAHTKTSYDSSSATVKMCINDDDTYTNATGDNSRSAYDVPAVFVLEPVVPGEK